MYFSRIRLKPGADAAALARMGGGDYALHGLVYSLCNCHPPDRDFLYRFESGRAPCFFVISTRKPQDTSDNWKIESKEYDPKLTAGDRLEFSVRVNPVVTRRDEQGKHKRHDVVMNAKNALKTAGKSKDEWPPPGELWREALIGWLRSRCGKHGFDFVDEDIRVDGYMPTRIWRRKQKEPVQITTVEIYGILTVTGPALFRKLLFEGLGPAKGFGCGLMLVKRVHC